MKLSPALERRPALGEPKVRGGALEPRLKDQYGRQSNPALVTSPLSGRESSIQLPHIHKQAFLQTACHWKKTVLCSLVDAKGIHWL